MSEDGVTLLTPVAAKDADRSELLLDSLESTGTTFRHVLVLDTEHVETVGSRLQRRHPHVEIAATADVLDARTERRRHRPVSRKRPGYWLRGHWRDEPRIYGWRLQQVLKLSFAAADSSTAVVCVDSDLVALRRLALDDFVEGDVPILLESSDTDGEMASWEIESLRVLNVPLQGTPLRRHTFEPAILAPTAVRELLAELGEDRWVDTFAMSTTLTEYALHGAWRRHRSQVPLTTRTPDHLARSVRFARDVSTWQTALDEARTSGAAFFHAQSTLGLAVSEIRGAVGLTR